MNCREYEIVDIKELVGKTITKIDGGKKGDSKIVFHTSDGSKYMMWHEQDCCEHVYLEDVCGDWEDLIDREILLAYEPSNIGSCEWDSQTWTFYQIASNLGTVALRWLGESNGYYSKSVEFGRFVGEKY